MAIESTAHAAIAKLFAKVFAKVRRKFSQAAIAKVFAKFRRKNWILLVVWTPWRVWEVEDYALSKFQPPTTLGDLQNVEKTIR